MERREFIKKTTVSSSLLTGIGLSDIISYDISEASTKNENGKMPLVAVCASNDPELHNPAPIDEKLNFDQIRDVVWLALDRDTSTNNLCKIVKKDSWVIIKPNIVCVTFWQRHNPNRYPDPEGWGLVTDLRAVKAVIEYLIDRVGPRRITIAEGPSGWHTSGGKFTPDEFEDGWNCQWAGFDNLSYIGIVEEMNSRQSSTKVDLLDLNEDEAVYVTDFDPYKTGIGAFQFVPPGDHDSMSDTENTRRKGILLPRAIMERDVLITMPAMKTHGNVGTTLFMKNFIGCVHAVAYLEGKRPERGGFSKNEIHKGSDLNLVRGIADLTAAINPDYGIAEGFWATQNFHSGQFGVYINHNVVVAGADIVAAEAVANMIMGFNPLDSDLLRMCNMKKLGEWHPDKISISGPPVKKIRRNFGRAANMYTARGIRKWIMLGPLKKPIVEIPDLKPELGATVGELKWRLMDGDSIIDTDPQMDRFMRYKESLLYTIPGSVNARKNSCFYLALKVNTKLRELVSELLIGIKGGNFRVFLNGNDMRYDKEPFQYDPTGSTFMKFKRGDNILILEITKLSREKQEVKIAVNICDLDGDRLTEPSFYPIAEEV